MDASWRAWTKENLERGCDPAEICDTLTKHQFRVEDIMEAMGAKFPGMRPVIRKSDVDYKGLANIPITKMDGKNGVTRIDTPKLQLYMIDDFLTGEECDAIVKVAEKKLRPSLTTHDNGDKYYRTSSTCDLTRMGEPVVTAIEEKIARRMGINLAYSEDVQAQRYEVGQEFKQHTDFFEPNTKEFEKFGGRRGNRTWTCMIYLNETPKGGGTKFFAIDKVFYPKKGRALAWNNLYEDGSPNRDTLHSGMPVEEGNKIIITKWFRERVAVPMFIEGKW